jgi:serine/threonine protein kinase
MGEMTSRLPPLEKLRRIGSRRKKNGRAESWHSYSVLPEHIKDYRIEGVCSDGGFGVTLEAKYLGGSEEVPVIIKAPKLEVFEEDPSVIWDIFEMEDWILSGALHPNIASSVIEGICHRMIDYCDIPHLVVERLPHTVGEFLDVPETMLKSGADDFMERFFLFMGQSVEALHKLHTDYRLVHGDIKPLHFMIGSDGLLKLYDFGGLKAIDSPYRNGCCTRKYFPNKGHPAVTGEWVDLYAYGKSLISLLAPMTGISDADLEKKMLACDDEELTDLLKDAHVDHYLVNHIIGRCLGSVESGSTFTTDQLRKEVYCYGRLRGLTRTPRTVEFFSQKTLEEGVDYRERDLRAMIRGQ